MIKPGGVSGKAVAQAGRDESCCGRAAFRLEPAIVAYLRPTPPKPWPGMDDRRRVLERFAADRGRPVSVCVVEAGADAAAPFGPALLRVLKEARGGAVAALLVEHVDCLSDDRTDAMAIAIEFRMRGVEILEARPRDVRRVGLVLGRGPAAPRRGREPGASRIRSSRLAD